MPRTPFYASVTSRGALSVAPAALANDRRGWLYEHTTGTPGATIATVSALSVVNFQLLPPPARWLRPLLVGAPAIAAWIGRHRRQTHAAGAA